MAELAGYEFIQTLGKGAMGAVYLARQTALNRYVAAKQILGAWNGDPEVLARFQREAQALARMNHPNVVGIYDLNASGSDLFMIMEYVRGPSLRQLMNQSPLSRAQALRVLAEVSAALDYASGQSIIHRDLKPGNVFVTAEGVCKLGDFGLVKMISGQANFVTQVGTILGTPAYMSPEQAAGKPDIDQRADVYALSVMAYEMLVGRLPFPSVPGNVMASLDAHISSPVPRPSDIAPGFPKKVEEALIEGLAKEPKKRPRSAGEFFRNLSEGADKAWPGWAAASDLAGIASAASPPTPPPLPAPGMPVASSAPAPIEVQPPPPFAPPSPMAATLPTPVAEPPAPSADEEESTPADSDETVVLGEPSADETVVLGGGLSTASADDTVVLGSPSAGPAADETVVLGAGAASPPPASPSFIPPSPAPSYTPPAAPAYTPPTPPPTTPSAPPPAPPSFAPPPPAATAAPPPPAPPPTGSWAAPQMAPPVYQPPKAAKTKKRGGTPWLILALLLLVILGAGAYVAIARLHVFGGGTALAVTGATASVDNATGNCPSHTYVFTGKVISNGAGGPVTYQWVQPDGVTTKIDTTVLDSQTTSPTTLRFTFQGNGHASGDALLHIITPVDIKSAPIHVEYQCP